MSSYFPLLAIATNNPQVSELHRLENETKKSSMDTSRSLFQTRAIAAEHVREMRDDSSRADADRVKWTLEVFDHIRRLRSRTAGLADSADLLRDVNTIDKSNATEMRRLDKVKKGVVGVEHDLSLFKERQRQDYDRLTLLEGESLTVIPLSCYYDR